MRKGAFIELQYLLTVVPVEEVPSIEDNDAARNSQLYRRRNFTLI